MPGLDARRSVQMIPVRVSTKVRMRHHWELMGSRALSPWSLAAGRPSMVTGALVAASGLAFATLVIYPLSQVAPVVSLSVVYLPAVVVI
jgi:hypothetical protein